MHQVFKKNGCIIHIDPTLSNPVSAWVDNGQTIFYIRPKEKDMFRFDPDRALMFMIHKVNKGIYRCSKCGWEGKKEELKRGQFADILCVACHEDFKAQIEKDSKTNRCLKCGQPRSICCC